MAFADDDLADREFLDDEDDEDLAESDTRDCPECGASVYEDVEQCPRCGSWITAETSPWSGRAGWWIALGVAGVIAVIWALSVGLPVISAGMIATVPAWCYGSSECKSMGLRTGGVIQRRGGLTVAESVTIIRALGGAVAITKCFAGKYLVEVARLLARIAAIAAAA